MKKALYFLAFLILFTTLSAHEFWLEPNSYFAEVGQPVRINLRVGENFTGEKWDAGKSRIIYFASFCRKKETTWFNMLQKRGLDSLDCRFSEAGTHLVVLKTNSKFIELEAEKFNDYLKEDGLDLALNARILRGDTLKKGREMYRREAASLVQIGAKTSAIDVSKTGFDLKILPEHNPLDKPSNTPLNVQITFNNKPLEGALVRHWHKANDKTNIVFKRSDKKGKVQFQPLSGDNMISVVHMVEYPNKAEADWQSIWGNLTFGVK